MTDETTTIQTPAETPRCQKHPQVETWVSCGRCGKPLCPDCVRHGPVGVRCEECLYPEGRVRSAGVPRRLRQANIATTVLALVWTALLTGAALMQGRYDPSFLHLPAPNLLLAGIAGGTVGYLHYHICGHAWNGATRGWVALLGLAMPLLAAVVIFAFHSPHLAPTLPFILRSLVAMGISTFFAWLLVTMPD